jgi:hypothetical protein
MPDTAAQTDESDFAIPGESDEDSGGGQSTPTGGPSPAPAAQGGPQVPGSPQTSPMLAQDASNGPSTPASQPPQANGRAMFLGNLLKTILSGAMAGGQQGQGAFSRGMAAGSPAGQQAAQQQQQKGAADVSKAQSEADIMKTNVALTGIKMLNAEYDLKRLPQAEQQKHLDAISAFKDGLIKNGANVEAEGDDEKASDSQATQMNSTDPRSTNHQGRFYSLPTMDSSGKAKFDVVYVPSKDVLQNDFKFTGADGKDVTLPAGMPLHGVVASAVTAVQKGIQNDVKDQHKQLADALKPGLPDADIPSTVKWLEQQAKENTPLYQQNKQAMDNRAAGLRAAHADMFGEKVALAGQKAAATAAAKPADTKMYQATDEEGNVVAGSMDELKSAGVSKGITKADDDTAKKVTVARQLTSPSGLFSLINQDMRALDAKGKMGSTVTSRLNDALLQKAGSDPDYAPLFVHTHLLATALMQSHVGSRGSSDMMEEFKKLADSGKMNASTLRASLGAEYKYVNEKAMRPKAKAADKTGGQ